MKLENLDFSDEITKDKLLQLLKKKASNIHINDIMNACAFLLDEGKYIQKSYRKEYFESYVKGFILRVKEIKENQETYGDYIDLEELKESWELLEEQEKLLIKMKSVEGHFFSIYQVISIYTTFILEEPIHPVGTPFPGGFEVKYEDGTYLCPVKEKQKDNPNAVCGFCIAEQDESV
jgi:uncharacterized protein (UPF0305 family)